MISKISTPEMSGFYFIQEGFISLNFVWGSGISSICCIVVKKFCCPSVITQKYGGQQQRKKRENPL